MIIIKAGVGMGFINMKLDDGLHERVKGWAVKNGVTLDVAVDKLLKMGLKS